MSMPPPGFTPLDDQCKRTAKAVDALREALKGSRFAAGGFVEPSPLAEAKQYLLERISGASAQDALQFAQAYAALVAASAKPLWPTGL